MGSYLNNLTTSEGDGVCAVGADSNVVEQRPPGVRFVANLVLFSAAKVECGSGCTMISIRPIRGTAEVPQNEKSRPRRDNTMVRTASPLAGLNCASLLVPDIHRSTRRSCTERTP